MGSPKIAHSEEQSPSPFTIWSGFAGLRRNKEPLSVEDAVKVFEPCIAEAVVSLKDEIIKIDRDFKTFEGAKFDDELARWKKYYLELKNFGKAGK